MYSSVNTRSAAAYKRASVESSVAMADPHQLVVLLFEALQRHLACAKLALQSHDISAKCYQMGAALRILEEGLKAPLDLKNGGEVAKNLDALYDYCVRRLILANAKNDIAGIDEVSALIAPVASGWKQMPNVSGQQVRAA